MNWVLLIIAVCLGAWTIWTVISAQKHDRETHVKGQLSSWNHLEVMAGYYTAALVIGIAALVLLMMAVTGN